VNAQTAPAGGGVPGTERRFLSPQEIADIVGLHPAVIRRVIDRGELRGHKLCGKWRVRRDEFDEWLDRNLVRTYDP
jgi:excisionase family DNA binding protein